MERRTYLKSVPAVLGSISLSGCLNSENKIKLTKIYVANWDRDDRHDIDLSIEYDGESIYDDTLRVGAADGEVQWKTITDLPDAPGSYHQQGSVLDMEAGGLDFRPEEGYDLDCMQQTIALQQFGKRWDLVSLIKRRCDVEGP